MQRQTAAIAGSGDRREELRQVRVPALVLHGEDDRMNLPVAGRATARASSRTRGWATLPRAPWPAIAGEIAELARRTAPAVS